MDSPDSSGSNHYAPAVYRSVLKEIIVKIDSEDNSGSNMVDITNSSLVDVSGDSQSGVETETC